MKKSKYPLHIMAFHGPVYEIILMTSLQKKKKMLKLPKLLATCLYRCTFLPFSFDLHRLLNATYDKEKEENSHQISTKYQTRQGQNIYIRPTPMSWTGPDSSVGRVSAPGNGRSRVRSRAATHQSRKKWY